MANALCLSAGLGVSLEYNDGMNALPDSSVSAPLHLRLWDCIWSEECI